METTRDIVIAVRAQAGRIASDLDSEKRTRADSHNKLNQKLDRIEARLRRAEYYNAVAIGILLTLAAANYLGFFDSLKPNNTKQNQQSYEHKEMENRL